MHVLLVNPPFSGIYHRLGFIFPPLGLAYLAAVLRSQNISVDIVDLAVDPQGLECLTKHHYDLVGITGDTCRHPTVIQIAREAKKYGCLVVLGGPHVTYRDDEILEQSLEVDFIVRREGELTLLELVQMLSDSRSLDSVKGLSFRGSDGSVFRTDDRPFIKDLDDLPLPARDLLPMHKYRTLELRRRKITPIVTSRGCPFNCPFCCSSEFAGTKWRTHSLDRTLSEIELVQNEYNYDAIAFIDDTFTIDMKRMSELSRRIVEKKLDLRWWCFSRPDLIVKNEPVVEEMAKAGARYIFMGIESGEDTILSRLKHGVKRSHGVEAINLLGKYGIETMASYMLCDVEETIESAERTISFARSLPTGAAQFSILTPFPGTVIFDQLEHLLLHREWSQYDCTHLVFEHPHISADQAGKLHSRAYKRYYLTPKRIISGLLSFIRGKGVKLSKILPVLTDSR